MGDQVQFKCISTINVTWTHDGEALEPDVETMQIDRTRYLLVINNVQHKHGGTYICRSDDRGIIISNYGELDVNSKN